MSVRLGLSSVALASIHASAKTPETIARHCRGLELGAVELRPDYLREQALPPAGIARIMGAHGLRLIYATDTLLADHPQGPAEPESPLRRDFAIARSLDAEILRIFPGDLSRLGPEASTVAAAWGDFAAAEGRRLVLENIGEGPGSDPLELAQFARNARGRLYVNFDVGNAARAGFDPAATLDRIRDVTVMLHLKGLRPEEAGRGDAAAEGDAIDFAAIARVLRGWDGPACLEEDAGPEPWTTLAAWVRWLRSAGFPPPGRDG
ncbi:MAG TPA: TIM barrel protein [bacterium]|nr:TIM barrel protein [bacterium]